jgi:hypothetical protein
LPQGERLPWKTLAKTNTSTNLGLPIDKEKGRSFTGVHGIDQAMGSGPNAFSVEMVGDNSGIGGTGVLSEQFWRRRRRGWREKA